MMMRLMLMIMMMMLLSFLMLLLVMSLVVNLYSCSVPCRRGAVMVTGACLGRVHAHPDEEPIAAA